jgi:hypothetical protein
MGKSKTIPNSNRASTSRLDPNSSMLSSNGSQTKGNSSHSTPRNSSGRAKTTGNSMLSNSKGRTRTTGKSNAQQQQRPDEHNQQERAQQQWGNAHPRRTQEQQRVEQSAWQEHRARSWQSDHRTWQQRGGYRGYRIPDDRYRGYFGPEHWFRIQGRPFLVVGGYPRFQYEGYWISAVDPWPEYWGDDWYDTDDVYVNYADNGYYLYNRRYPTAPGIAISISF